MLLLLSARRLLQLPWSLLSTIRAQASVLSVTASRLLTVPLGAESIVRNAHSSASSPGVLEYVHVRSHTGEFANEVVDVAAKLASRDVWLGNHPLPDLDVWLAHGGRSLSWVSLPTRRWHVA